MEIPTLEEKEKKQAIEKIVECAFVESDQQHPLELLKKIGIHSIFFGVQDVCFLALVLDLMITAFLVSGVYRNRDLLMIGLFTLSPLLYGLLEWLTLWKTEECQTRELLGTLKISLHRVTALRMLFFGGSGVMMNGAVIMAVWLFLGKSVPIVQLFGVSLCALFFYAFVSLLSFRFLSESRQYILVGGLWLMVTILMTFNSKWTGQILYSMPVWLAWTLAAGAAFCYLLELRSFYQREFVMQRI